MHVQTGEYRTVITQGFRIGHVQYSPTDDSIFYVWETGGYAPQRTWLVDADGTATGRSMPAPTRRRGSRRSRNGSRTKRGSLVPAR